MAHRMWIFRQYMKTTALLDRVQNQFECHETKVIKTFNQTLTQEFHEKSHSLRDGLERGKTGRTR